MKTRLSHSVRTLVLAVLVCTGVTGARAQTLTPLHQYRYGNFEDFFYTTNFGELGNGGGGWVHLYCTMSLYDSEVEGTIPFYRFYSPYYGTHFYSTNPDEVGAPYWQSEGVAGYIWPNSEPGTQAIRRYFKWVGSGPVHIYKFYDSDSDLLVQNGWIPEGIVGYAPSGTCF